MGPHTAIRRAAPYRRSVFVSRTADHAEIHRQFGGRPIFSSRLLTILFRRSDRGEISALPPQHRPLAERVVPRCSGERARLLSIDLDEHAAAEICLGLRARRLYPGQD